MTVVLDFWANGWGQIPAAPTVTAAGGGRYYRPRRPTDVDRGALSWRPEDDIPDDWLALLAAGIVSIDEFLALVA